MLQQHFNTLASRYTTDHQRIAELWQEIVRHYTQRGRHYHTLEHLEQLLTALLDVKDQVMAWDALLFSLYYHDIIYNPLKQDNEAQSALLAEKRMAWINVPGDTIALTKEQILATQSHTVSVNPDTNLFTDADLAILGRDWNTYAGYCRQIRQEYAVFPDMLYKPGRKKVLTRFLQMDRIYKTDYFFDKLEAQARDNLQRELEGL